MSLKFGMLVTYWWIVCMMVMLLSHVSWCHEHCHVRKVTFTPMYRKLFKLQLIFKSDCCLVSQDQDIDRLLYYSRYGPQLLDNPFRIALEQNENITRHLFLDSSTGNVLSTFLEFSKYPNNKYLACLKEDMHLYISAISWKNVTALSACGVSLEMLYNVMNQATFIHYLFVCFYSPFFSKIVNIFNTSLQDLTICCAHLTGYIIHAPQLKRISLYNTQINNIRFDQVTRDNIKDIEIHSTVLTSINDIIYQTVTFPALVTLSTSHSIFSNVQTMFIETQVYHVEILDLSYCSTVIFDSFAIYSSLPNLKSINLSGNSIISYKPNLFTNMRFLRKISLVNCFLSTANYSIHLEFNTLNNIEFIDLSSNKLKKLYINSSKPIQHLDLSKNSLTMADVGIECGTVHCVKLLNLSYNKVLVNTDMIKRAENLKIIDIGHNILPCTDCDFLRSDIFQKLKKNTLNITLLDLNSDKLKCTSPDNENSLFDLNINSLCPIDHTMTAVAITLATIGLVSVILASVGYIYRHEIYYIMEYIKLKRNQKKDRENDEHDNIQNKKYDAFISYSTDDWKWVWKELKPALEEGAEKYKLCFNDREFPLGSFVYENIEEALKDSQSCVMIITNSYVLSEEEPQCQLEQRLITNSQIEGYNVSLVLIILGDLMSVRLPTILQTYMLKKTYIEWNTEKSSKDFLLRQLKDSLGKSIHQKTKNSSVT